MGGILDSQPDFIRPSFKRSWNRRKIDHDHPLLFTREVEEYFDEGNADIEGTLGEIAQQATAYQGQSIISAIPCFALEKPDYAVVSNHINQIAREDGHTIIFVNADSRQLQNALQELVHELIACLTRRCLPHSFSIAGGMLGGPQPIGRIRAVLNDTILLLALQHKVRSGHHF